MAAKKTQTTPPPFAAPADARGKLIHHGVELFRRNGFVATSVDEICEEAGVTKGAFFHHFESKEDLAKACLEEWRCRFGKLVENAPFQAIENPAEKVLGVIDFFIGLFSNPKLVKSCLAGTTVQEVSETHPGLRKAANACF